MRPLSEIRNYLGNYQVKSGVYHYYRNEFTQALAFLRKALGEEESLSEGDRKNARSYLALSLRGHAEKLAAEGEIEAGLEELREAADVCPDYPDLHYRIAGLYEKLGRGEEAIEAYRRAIDRHGSYLDARVALGYALLEAGRTDEATEVFEQAAKLKLERIERPFRNGIEALRAGESGKARGLLHEVFLTEPRLANEYLDKALEMLRAEEYERALYGIERALELNPHYPDLHNFRGIVLCELDRPEEAVEAFRQSAERSPDQVVPRLNLAFARIRAGRWREAEAELESILESRPEEPVAAAKLEELRADQRGMGARPSHA